MLQHPINDLRILAIHFNISVEQPINQILNKLAEKIVNSQHLGRMREGKKEKSPTKTPFIQKGLPLEEIVKHLDPQDIKSLILTCKAHNENMEECDNMWRGLIQKEFDVPSHSKYPRKEYLERKQAKLDPEEPLYHLKQWPEETWARVHKAPNYNFTSYKKFKTVDLPIDEIIIKPFPHDKTIWFFDKNKNEYTILDSPAVRKWIESHFGPLAQWKY